MKEALRIPCFANPKGLALLRGALDKQGAALKSATQKLYDELHAERTAPTELSYRDIRVTGHIHNAPRPAHGLEAMPPTLLSDCRARIRQQMKEVDHATETALMKELGRLNSVHTRYKSFMKAVLHTQTLLRIPETRRHSLYDVVLYTDFAHAGVGYIIQPYGSDHSIHCNSLECIGSISNKATSISRTKRSGNLEYENLAVTGELVAARVALQNYRGMLDRAGMPVTDKAQRVLLVTDASVVTDCVAKLNTDGVKVAMKSTDFAKEFKEFTSTVKNSNPTLLQVDALYVPGLLQPADATSVDKTRNCTKKDPISLGVRVPPEGGGFRIDPVLEMFQIDEDGTLQMKVFPERQKRIKDGSDLMGRFL